MMRAVVVLYCASFREVPRRITRADDTEATGRVRLAVHGYNTRDDIQRALTAIGEALNEP